MQFQRLSDCPLEDVAVILNYKFWNSYHQVLVSWAFPVKLPQGECHKTLLMISQH